jgi:hypothetical protein
MENEAQEGEIRKMRIPTALDFARLDWYGRTEVIYAGTKSSLPS